MSTNLYMSDHKSLPESGKTGFKSWLELFLLSEKSVIVLLHRMPFFLPRFCFTIKQYCCQWVQTQQTSRMLFVNVLSTEYKQLTKYTQLTKGSLCYLYWVLSTYDSHKILLIVCTQFYERNLLGWLSVRSLAARLTRATAVQQTRMTTAPSASSQPQICGNHARWALCLRRVSILDNLRLYLLLFVKRYLWIQHRNLRGNTGGSQIKAFFQAERKNLNWRIK